jgi:hypothetical protein
MELNDNGLIEVLFQHAQGGTEENHKESHGSRYVDRDSNRATPEYKSRSLPLHQPAQFDNMFND